MRHVVSISLGARSADYDITTRFLGQSVRVRRMGVDGVVDAALALIERWQRSCDAIGLGEVRDHLRVGAQRLDDATTARLEAAVTAVPAATGARLRLLLDEWTLRHVQRREGEYFTNARVLFLSGLASHRAAQVLSEYTRNLTFADPLLQLGAPRLLGSLRELERYAALTARLQGWLPRPSLEAVPPLQADWVRLWLRSALRSSTVVAAPYRDLARLGAGQLGGKIVLTSTIPDEALRQLGAQGVDAVVDLTPQLLDRVVGADVLEAVLLAALGKRRSDEVAEGEYLEALASLKLEPRMVFPTGERRRVNRFAFVIHPLSRDHFTRVKPLEILSRVAPRTLSLVEKLMAYLPPFVYSHVSGIESPSGVRAEGWLISVGGTPKELLAHGPEFTYRRLEAAARMAERLGAQILGLGGFVKVVGDAGVTVARRVEIPVTTGNSYSAAAALWAAAEAVKRLGLVSLDERGKVASKTMVIGATGAIGSACARLLARSSREVYLVSPEVAKLLTLRESILAETPDAKLHLASRADESLGEVDMIVTATAGAGKKVLDIMKVKPGCVITDIARPLDLPPSEVAKRPDVLVVESGEIRLPGQVRMKDVGLPRGVAYACLAETIVLALEGRFEEYTVGRKIPWEKVKEIYELGLKHGMKLAAIAGVNGVYSDEDFARVRALALKALAAQGRGPDAAAPARKAAGRRNGNDPRGLDGALEAALLGRDRQRNGAAARNGYAGRGVRSLSVDASTTSPPRR